MIQTENETGIFLGAPEPESGNNPFRIKETDFSGLSLPWELTAITPGDGSDHWIKTCQVRQDLGHYLLDGLEISQREGEACDWGIEFDDETGYVPTVSQVARIRPEAEMPPLPRHLVLEHIFSQQAETIQPKLVSSIIDGYLSFLKAHTTDPDGIYLEDHGGGTRKVLGNTSVLQGNLIDHNTDDMFRTLCRWNLSPYTKPVGQSPQSPYARLVSELIPRFGQANMDMYGPFRPQDLSAAIPFVQEAVSQFLHKEQIDFMAVPTFDQAGENNGVEIRIPIPQGMQERFWQPVRIHGYEGATLHPRHLYFEFAPPLLPDSFVIEIQTLHPQGNDDWTLLSTAFGIARNGSYLDVNQIYLNPVPTAENGLLNLDQRHGEVDSLQHDFFMKYYPGGIVTTPSPEAFWEHETTIPEEFIANETDINRLASKLSRTIRYYVLKNIFGPTVDDPELGYEATNLWPALQKIFDRMNYLYGQGERISHDKSIEMFADLLIAVQHNPRLTGDIIRTAITYGREIKGIFPNMHYTRLMPGLRSPNQRMMPDGTAIVFDAPYGQISLNSGMYWFIYNLSADLRRGQTDHPAYVEKILGHLKPYMAPAGNVLELLMWFLDPYPPENTNLSIPISGREKNNIVDQFHSQRKVKIPPSFRTSCGYNIPDESSLELVAEV